MYRYIELMNKTYLLLIRLAMVPEGTYKAASFPVNSAHLTSNAAYCNNNYLGRSLDDTLIFLNTYSITI